jgi:hypothetical protein
MAIPFSLPDPLAAADDYLEESIGKICQSAIHGDLNLTNVLLGLDNEGQAKIASLIDYSYFVSKAPTVLDYVKMEVDFWNTVFADKSKLIKNEEFIQFRQQLDSGQTMSNIPGFNFIQGLRQHANKRLTSTTTQNYFIALYLMRITSLQYYPVKEEKYEPIRRLALLGAACDLLANENKNATLSVTKRRTKQKKLIQKNPGTSQKQHIKYTKEDKEFLEYITQTLKLTIDGFELNGSKLFKQQLLEIFKQNLPKVTTDDLVQFLIEQCINGRFFNLLDKFQSAIKKTISFLPKSDDVKRNSFRITAKKFFDYLLIFNVNADLIKKNPEIAYSLFKVCHELHHTYLSRQDPYFIPKDNHRIVEAELSSEEGIDEYQYVIKNLLCLLNKIEPENELFKYQKQSDKDSAEKAEKIAKVIRVWLKRYKTNSDMEVRTNICLYFPEVTDLSMYVKQKIKELIPELDCMIVALPNDQIIDVFYISYEEIDRAVSSYFDILDKYLK